MNDFGIEALKLYTSNSKLLDKPKICIIIIEPPLDRGVIISSLNEDKHIIICRRRELNTVVLESGTNSSK